MGCFCRAGSPIWNPDKHLDPIRLLPLPRSRREGAPGLLLLLTHSTYLFINTKRIY